MSRIITLSVLSIVLTSTALVVAQATPPDYHIEVSDHGVDQTTITISYLVYNQGGPAQQSTLVKLMEWRGELTGLGDSSDELAHQELRPLGDGDREASAFELPVEQFPPGETVTVYLTVSGDTEDPRTLSNNSSRAIAIAIPGYTQSQPQAGPQVPPPQQQEEDTESQIVDLPFFDITVDLSKPENQLIVVGIVASALMILWFLSLIIRMLARRPPAFGAWQPPYATMPPLDPNSTYGRRQAWQQHANDNRVPLPCQPGSYHARKVLLGTDLHYLSGWRILALRMTQFDLYGRVFRSQVMASRRAIKRLNRLSRKADSLEGVALAQKVRPVAKTLAKHMRKKINRRSAMLAIALDTRFRGTHGEVRIVFELYECRDGQPHLLDRWEPEMTVIGKTIHEIYTYTIHGQRPGESFKAFRKRLQEDIERVLVNLLCAPMVAPPQQPSQQPQAPAAPTPAGTPTATSLPEAPEAANPLPETGETVRSDVSESNDEAW